MTRGQAVAKLRKIRQCDDLEAAHVEADEVLCCLLRSLGFSEVVAEYDKIKKWYA